MHNHTVYLCVPSHSKMFNCPQCARKYIFQNNTEYDVQFRLHDLLSILPEDAIIMGSTWHRSIRRTDWQVYVRLSRLSIHRLWLWTKTPRLLQETADGDANCTEHVQKPKHSQNTIMMHIPNWKIDPVNYRNTAFHRSIIIQGLAHKHTASHAGRSNRKTAEGSRLEGNVRLDQLIWFISTWLQENSARLSRHLGLTLLGSCAFKKNKN